MKKSEIKQELIKFGKWLYEVDGMSENPIVENLVEDYISKSSHLQIKKSDDNNKEFSVHTYSLLDNDVLYCHWSEGLNMIIEKDGNIIKLNSEEIQRVVKSLPRTIGGRY